MRIDLDAARAARREATQEAPVIALGGQDFVLPIELPFEVADLLGQMAVAKERGDQGGQAVAVVQMVRLLLGEGFDEFMKQNPSLDDLLALMDGMTRAYGVEDAGESPASDESS